MAIDELFDIEELKTDNWKRTRIRIISAALITRRLKGLKQMDLVDSAIGNIKRHMKLISKNPLEQNIELFVECEILRFGRSLMPSQSAIDCLISKIIEFTKHPKL